MKTEKIIIENRIYFVNEFTYININVNVPAKNLQNMIAATSCKIINKKEVELSYNHNAGLVYRCEIRVSFEKIRTYLCTGSIFDCENKSDYVNMLYDKKHLGHYDVNILKDSIGLYAFGDCSKYINISPTTFYFYANGRMIQLNNTKRTDYGKKRYVKNGKQWVSNRKF